MGKTELKAIETRLAAASGVVWSPSVQGGLAVVLVRLANGHESVMRITRDRSPASVEDVEFIAHARNDVLRLVAHVEEFKTLADNAISEIEERCRRASPAPWKAFVEEDGGVGGSNVIWVSDSDSEPDLYLWFGDQLAPGSDFEFVAAARQDIPALVAAARRRIK